MASSTGLPAFLRDISGLQIVLIDPQKEVLDIDENREVQKVKVATWSPDGQLLAFVDPNEGVGVAVMGEEAQLEMTILPGSSKSTVGIYWSPLSSTLVTALRCATAKQKDIWFTEVFPHPDCVEVFRGAGWQQIQPLRLEDTC
eukprot:symbB.v1.2.010072.t1/scaffold649.1/size176475/2